MHEDPVEVAGLHAADLYRLVAPAHDLPGADVGHAGGQLAPLQHDVLGHLQYKHRVSRGNLGFRDRTAELHKIVSPVQQC